MSGGIKDWRSGWGSYRSNQVDLNPTNPKGVCASVAAVEWTREMK